MKKVEALNKRWVHNSEEIMPQTLKKLYKKNKMMRTRHPRRGGTITARKMRIKPRRGGMSLTVSGMSLMGLIS